MARFSCKSLSALVLAIWVTATWSIEAEPLPDDVEKRVVVYHKTNFTADSYWLMESLSEQLGCDLLYEMSLNHKRLTINNDLGQIEVSTTRPVTTGVFKARNVIEAHRLLLLDVVKDNPLAKTDSVAIHHPAYGAVKLQGEFPRLRQVVLANEDGPCFTDWHKVADFVIRTDKDRGLKTLSFSMGTQVAGIEFPQGNLFNTFAQVSEAVQEKGSWTNKGKEGRLAISHMQLTKRGRGGTRLGRFEIRNTDRKVEPWHSQPDGPEKEIFLWAFAMKAEHLLSEALAFTLLVEDLRVGVYESMPQAHFKQDNKWKDGIWSSVCSGEVDPDHLVLETIHAHINVGLAKDYYNIQKDKKGYIVHPVNYIPLVNQKVEVSTSQEMKVKDALDMLVGQLRKEGIAVSFEGLKEKFIENIAGPGFGKLNDKVTLGKALLALTPANSQGYWILAPNEDEIYQGSFTTVDDVSITD